MKEHLQNNIMEQNTETVTELFDQLHPLLTQERSYYEFKRILKKILEKLKVLHQEETDPTKKQNYLMALTGLAHTDDKEVDYVKSYQDKMHKRNAAMVRADEYYKSIENAYDFVKMDLMMVLIMEKEEKVGSKQ